MNKAYLFAGFVAVAFGLVAISAFLISTFWGFLVAGLSLGAWSFMVFYESDK